MNRIATAANASLISNRSMSSTSRPALASALRRGRRRAGQHDRRVGAGDRGGDDAGARGEAEVLADLLVADRHERGAVDDAGGVAGVVDVVDLLDPVVLLQRHGVEAGLVADAGEATASAWRGPRRVDSGLMNSSWSSTVTPLTSLTGTTERAKQPLAQAFAARRVGLDGEGVDVLAGEALDGGDQVGADALRDEAGGEARSPGRSPRRRRRSPSATRLIDSTPPARIRSSKPPRTRRRGLVDGLEAARRRSG